ncbi:MAG: hypothetical protein HOP29_04215 [Phycisphaerales bacterium]|nr:hypothetical protein [Phycisphaerales bacterium]
MIALTQFHDAPEEHGGGCGSCEAQGGDAPRCGNGLEKVYRTTAVRYGYMRHVGEFDYAEGMKFTCGAKVVVQTGRGVEIGELASVSCTGCDKHLSREQIKTYIANSGPESYQLENGRVLREATADDLAEDVHLKERTFAMRRFAQQRADDQQLSIKIVDCEYLLGGDRVIIYFSSEGRVDFRGLVKDCAGEFQTRVKMHQVGARDEARLVADFETCGREVCCKVFLKTLRPITMRMAKLQRSTLDPSKVSGRCGRLKCCLRYEHEAYEDLDTRLARMGERIRTSHGYGTVVNRQILTQLVQFAPAYGGEPITCVTEDVLERGIKEFPPEALEAPKPKREPVEPPPPVRDERPQRSADQTGDRRQSRHRRRPPSGPTSPPPQRPDAGRPPGRPEPPQRDPAGQAKRRRRRRRRPGEGPAPGGQTAPG